MSTLNEVLTKNLHGLYYGNRILLPFKADILKAVIEKSIITDFSDFSEQAEYEIKDNRTEIYFYEYADLSEFITTYETIKLIVVEEGRDIFDTKNHIKLILHLNDGHEIKIEEAGENFLFIE